MLHQTLKEILLKKGNFNSIVGQEQAKEQITSALLTGRHLIIVGPPGVGKTTIAKNIGMLLPKEKKTVEKKNEKNAVENNNFIRVQGSPDLTAEDLIGDIDPIKALKFGASSSEAFSPGKIFLADKGVLFFDEINRAPERLQNALLQVLEENEVTIGSYRIAVPTNFILVATMNPEDSNTEKLSAVFLDRFDVVEMSYPESIEDEIKIVKEKAVRSTTESVFPDKLLQIAITFVRTLRVHPKVEKAAGVRASIGLYERALSTAYLRGHKEVKANDLQDILISVLAHRIELKPSVRYAMSTETFLKKELKKIRLDEQQEDEQGDVG